MISLPDFGEENNSAEARKPVTATALASEGLEPHLEGGKSHSELRDAANMRSAALSIECVR